MKKAWRVGLIAGGVVLAAGLVLAACLVFRPHIKNVALNSALTEAEPVPEVVSANAKYLFTGTTFWGRRTNKKARASELGILRVVYSDSETRVEFEVETLTLSSYANISS